MRKSHWFGVSAVVLLLLAATGMYYSKYHRMAAQYAQLQSEDDNTRMRYGQAINDIAAIQDSLNAIVLGDQSGGLVPTKLQSELQLSENHGDEALARISVLKASIQRTKAKIEDLDRTLKQNHVEIAGLHKMVASLRRNLKEKEERITELATTVDTLETRVTGLTADVEDKRRELGTIYYAMGSKRDLTKQGVVVAKGGVLGVGKTLLPSKQADEGVFTALDTDQETVIPIPAKKAQVVSAQALTSYVLMPSTDGHMELRIIDPKEFRKIKHLVIVTA